MIAGVYLILDNFLFINNKTIFSLVFILRIFTLFIRGVISLVEVDLKKIIALSTLRQLSIIFISLTFRLNLFCFFHLLCHAIFKSLLFFRGGVIIHYFFRNQDFRSYRFFSLELNFILILRVRISLINLIGIFFLSGFFSKDIILGIIRFSFSLPLFFFIVFFILRFTFFYCKRLFFMFFFSGGKIKKLVFFNKKVNSFFFSLFILSLFSLFIGQFFIFLFFNIYIINRIIRFLLFILRFNFLFLNLKSFQLF